MIYESFKIIHKFDNIEYSSITSDKQRLFESFLRKTPDFVCGKVLFQEYNFDEFVLNYSIDVLAEFVKSEYQNKYGELYFCGKKFDSEIGLIMELKNCKKILKITVENL